MKIQFNRRWFAITSALVATFGSVMPPVFAQAAMTSVHQANLSNLGHASWSNGVDQTHTGSFDNGHSNNWQSPKHHQPWITGYTEVPAGPYIYNPATGLSGPSGYEKVPIFSPTAPLWFRLQHMVAIPMALTAGPISIPVTPVPITPVPITPTPVTPTPVAPIGIAYSGSAIKPIALQMPPVNAAPIPAADLQLPSVNFTPLPIATFSAMDVYEASQNQQN